MIGSIIHWIVTGIIWLFKAFIIYMLLAVASSVFWKGETGREMRSCCFVYIIMAAVGCVITIPIAMCERRQDQKKQEPASLYSAPSQSGMVYVCTGPNSERYHKSSDCTGLSRCSGEIEVYSREEARSLGYTPCGICYR